MEPEDQHIKSAGFLFSKGSFGKLSDLLRRGEEVRPGPAAQQGALRWIIYTSFLFRPSDRNALPPSLLQMQLKKEWPHVRAKHAGPFGPK